MGMLDIEFELNRRKERLADMRRHIDEKLNVKNLNKNVTKDDIKISNGFVQEALEDYLNIFDRLSYFIRVGKFNENDFRTEYRDMLNDTISANEAKFRPGTRYLNMLKLNERWQSK